MTRENVLAALATARKFRLPATLVLLVLAIAFPLISALLFPDSAAMSIAVDTVIFAIVATSWNIFSGYTGYISLGHAVFFGVGAYALSFLCDGWHVTSDYGPFELLPLCGLIAAAVAIPIGFLALRTRGHTFVVITIATLFIAQLLAEDLRSFTGGTAGRQLPIPSWVGTDYEPHFYEVGLAILVVAVLTSWWIRSSKFGLGLLAIKDDEERARGLGVWTGYSKLLAYVTSAFFVGMAGGLFVYYHFFFHYNDVFNPLYDVYFALMPFLGGLGTLAGPLLGALIVMPAQLSLKADVNLSSWALLIFGGLFLVVILAMPEGILPTVNKRLFQWLTRGTAAGSSSPDVSAPSGPTQRVVTASRERSRP